MKAITQFICTKYNVTLQPVDWGKQYNNLAQGIRSFLNKTIAVPRKEYYDNSKINLEDINNYQQEARIWNKCEEVQREMLSHKSADTPQTVRRLDTKSFLNAKYRGRCQLCYRRTITGEKNAFSYTFQMVKPHENKLNDLQSNLFCLCPSCWGELQHGGYLGQDLTEVIRKAEEYSNYLKAIRHEGEFDPEQDCLIEEMYEQQQMKDDELKQLTDREREDIEYFSKPIIFRVIVNGKRRFMVFSWEHFLRLAFILSEPMED